MSPFSQIPNRLLVPLRNAFADGHLKRGTTMEHFLELGIGTELAGRLQDHIQTRSLSSLTCVEILDALNDLGAQGSTKSNDQSLVITGPPVKDIPVLKTGSRFINVVKSARSELMLATYALYQGKNILESVHEAMLSYPSLEVTMIVNVQRTRGSKVTSRDLIAPFESDFQKYNWPWEPKPKLYFYPPSLADNPKQVSSMHSKFVIADESRCFITSANFTQAAHGRNFEVGVEIEDSIQAKNLSQYFKTLIQQNVLSQINF